MKRKKTPFRPKQPTPQELRDNLAQFIRSKFYPGEAIAFTKDLPRLLSWVILWPATWLNERGVTLPASRYQEILTNVLMDAARFGTGKITYRPAWLKQAMQSHFRIHGEDYYEEGKSLRSLVESTLNTTSQIPRQTPDPIRLLAQAQKLLKPTKKPSPKPPVNDQLTLL